MQNIHKIGKVSSIQFSDFGTFSMFVILIKIMTYLSLFIFFFNRILIKFIIYDQRWLILSPFLWDCGNLDD